MNFEVEMMIDYCSPCSVKEMRNLLVTCYVSLASPAVVLT